MQLLNNRYELQDELGHGGMGVVYRAQDHLTGQTIALKQVLISESQLDFASKVLTADSDSIRMGLAQEFRVPATLRHPHIISVLDYGFDAQRRPFFTMELLDEPRTLIEAAKPLKPTQRLELILQVLEALKYLHRRQLLHRDLKPANILVTPDNQVKFVDFGLAVLQTELHDYLGNLVEVEVSEIRESYLTTAPLVGRAAELKQLQEAFDHTLDKQGSVWLIGGKSGVGKSRLVEELRIYALIKGATVLQGQATPEAMHPFAFWHKLLQSLLINPQVSPVDTAILVQAIPQVKFNIAQTLPSVSQLSSSEAELNRADAALTNILQAIDAPIVNLRESARWARLDALRQLLALGANPNLMIVGTFRIDEAPDLPTTLDNAQLITLNRLPMDDIETLMKSMIGDHIITPDTLNFVQKETEGNVFFLIEVIRALAEQVGSLSKIDQADLPNKVLTGGMENILQRRLERLPAHMRDILNVMAVIGRVIRQDILQNVLAQRPADAIPLDIATWLATCDDMAILDLYEQEWRFAHDRLREHIIGMLADSQAIYTQAAQAVEALYGDEEGQHQDAPLLASLWQHAGNMEREYVYLKAIMSTHEVFSTQVAYEYLTRIIEIDEFLGQRTEIALLRQGIKSAIEVGLKDIADNRLNKAENYPDLSLVNQLRTKLERIYWYTKWGDKDQIESLLSVIQLEMQAIDDEQTPHVNLSTYRNEFWAFVQISGGVGCF